MDDERLHDDLAGWACYRLDRVQKGFRVLHLFDRNGVMTKGVLLVRIKMDFQNASTATKIIEKLSV
jgi:hypothetical protein